MKHLIATLSIVLLCGTLLQAKTIGYVKASGSSAWNGRSNVSENLSDVLKNGNYDEVWVAGNHTISSSAITVSSNIPKIYGGFAGTENQVSERKLRSGHPFIFESESKLTLQNGGWLTVPSGCELNGFSIVSTSNTDFPIVVKGGKVSMLYCNGGKKQIQAENGIIEQCFFEANTADELIVQTTGSSVVANCSFSNNESLGSNGSPLQMTGVANEKVLEVEASSMLVNCSFLNNKGYKGGAARVANTVVSSCSFVNNSSIKSGGAIYLMPSSYVENSFFDGNTNGRNTKKTNDVYGDNCFSRERKVQYVASASADTRSYGDNNMAYDPAQSAQTYSASSYQAKLLTTANTLIDKGSAVCSYQVIDTVHYKEAVDVAREIRKTGSAIDVGASEFQQLRVQLWQKVILPDFVEDKSLVLTDDSLKLEGSQWVKADNHPQVELKATTAPQFKFKNWEIKEYSGSSPVTSTDNPWNYTIDSGCTFDSLNVIANLNIDNYAIKLVSNLPQGATLSSSESRVYYGQKTVLNADVKHGYQFKNWSWNGTVVSNQVVDTLLVKPNLVFGGTDSLIYKAELARDTCQVTVTMVPEGGGSLVKPDFFLYDSLVTLIVTPAQSMQIKKWTVNGDSVANTNQFKYLVQGDAAITVYLDSIYYQVDGSVKDPNATVELKGLNRKYAAGNKATIQAVLPTGYQFDTWEVYKNGSEAISAKWNDNPYTFTVNDNYRIVANVNHVTYDVTVGALPELSATVVKDKKSYFYGDSAVFTATIEDGYVIDDWRICTNGWTSYSCQDSYSQTVGKQEGHTAVLKMKIVDNVVVYAQQKVQTVDLNLLSTNGIVISQAGANRISVLQEKPEAWRLQIYNLCGLQVVNTKVTEKETFVTLPANAIYVLRFTKDNGDTFTEKLSVQ